MKSTLTFNKATTFCFARSILVNNDVLHTTDNISKITLEGKLNIQSGLSELSLAQIWDKPSFKGPADFIIS